MKVWILTEGELSEGSTIQGVFATRELGHGAFAELAQKLNDRFGIRDADVREDGGLYLKGGCDWIELAPHDVIEQLAITGR